jgi:hypothetical protein
MRSIFHLVKGYGSGLSLFIHRAVLNSLYADGTYRAIWAENSVGSAGLTYPQEILLNEMHAVCLNIITLTGQPGSAAILADTTGSIDIAIGSLDIAACGTNATDFPIRAINPNIQSNIRIGNLQSDSLNTPVAGFVTITGTPGYGSAEQSHFSVGSLPMTNITSLNDLGANPWGSLNSLATVQIPQLDNYTLTLVSNGSTLPLSWVYKSFAINGTSNPTTGLIIKLPGSYPWDGETVTVKAITNPLTGITFETVDGTNIPSTVTSIAGGQHVTFTYSSLIAGWQVSQ